MQKAIDDFFKPHPNARRKRAHDEALWAELEEAVEAKEARREAQKQADDERRKIILREVNRARMRASRQAQANARDQIREVAAGLGIEADVVQRAVRQVRPQLAAPENFPELVEVWRRGQRGRRGVRAVRHAFPDSDYVTAQSDASGTTPSLNASSGQGLGIGSPRRPPGRAGNPIVLRPLPVGPLLGTSPTPLPR